MVAIFLLLSVQLFKSLFRKTRMAKKQFQPPAVNTIGRSNAGVVNESVAPHASPEKPGLE
jgi:hypothetical protein